MNISELKARRAVAEDYAEKNSYVLANYRFMVQTAIELLGPNPTAADIVEILECNVQDLIKTNADLDAEVAEIDEALKVAESEVA